MCQMLALKVGKLLRAVTDCDGFPRAFLRGHCIILAKGRRSLLASEQESIFSSNLTVMWACLVATIAEDTISGVRPRYMH